MTDQNSDSAFLGNQVSHTYRPQPIPCLWNALSYLVKKDKETRTENYSGRCHHLNIQLDFYLLSTSMSLSSPTLDHFFLINLPILLLLHIIFRNATLFNLLSAAFEVVGVHLSRLPRLDLTVEQHVDFLESSSGSFGVGEEDVDRHHGADCGRKSVADEEREGFGRLTNSEDDVRLPGDVLEGRGEEEREGEVEDLQ